MQNAFVTKAEFDAALSDFNARLTTFEAGINSKIDSQVSSYLDRNGIWNGSRQTLLQSTVSQGLNMFIPNSHPNKSVWSCVGKTSYKLSDGLSKSGLACINYTILGTSVNYNEFYLSMSKWSTSSWANGMTATCSLIWTKKWFANDYDNTVASDNLVAAVAASSGSSAQEVDVNPLNTKITRLFYSPPWGTGSVYGFVSKGDTLYFGVTHVGSAAWYKPEVVEIAAEGNLRCNMSITIY